MNAESYRHVAPDRYLADQVKSGFMSLRVLNVEPPENALMATKFDAGGSALHLGVLIQGTEYSCPNQDIRFYTTNKNMFMFALQQKLTLLVGRAL